MKDDLGTLALEENLHTFRIADVQPRRRIRMVLPTFGKFLLQIKKACLALSTHTRRFGR